MSERKRSKKELAAIRRYYAMQKKNRSSKDSHTGKVYRGETKYIDPEPKKQRDYAVIRSQGTNVTVAKLKSIKIFDESGKNADPYLVEINHERYGLPNRTGVDSETFGKNRMSGKPLDLKDKRVFPNEKEEFTLGSHDKHKVLEHVGRTGNKKDKKK